jgi:hypothetical protein
MAANNNESILTSVQGALFVVKKETILSHDWILSKLITSDIPWQKTSDGQCYIDVDPGCFRLILSILNGIVDIRRDLTKLFGQEMPLLKATARYLLLDTIEKEIESFETGVEEKLRRNEELEKKILALSEKTKTFEEKLRRNEELEEKMLALSERTTFLEVIEELLQDLKLEFAECNAYRTHRPFNQCGCKKVILGPLSEDCSEGLCLSSYSGRIRTSSPTLDQLLDYLKNL